MLAVALGAATPCANSSPPSGNLTYTARAGPPATAAISMRHGVITVVTRASDRAFTTTTSRYDAATLALLSADQHAGCCLTEWNGSVRQDGAFYLAISIRRGPFANGTPSETRLRLRLPRRARPIVVDDLWLVPWVYHKTHATRVDEVVLPNISSDSIDVQTLRIVTVRNERPAGVPPADEALQVVPKTGTSRLLWYDPCTFVVDASATPTSIDLRRF